MSQYRWVGYLAIPVTFAGVGLWMRNADTSSMNLFQNMNLGLVGPLVAILLVVLGVIGLVIYLDKKRSSDLQAVASRLGLQFEAKGGAHRPSDYAGFALFTRGEGSSMSWFGGGPKIKNFISGAHQSVDFELFDYQYSRSYYSSSAGGYGRGGYRRQTVHHTVILCQNPGNLISDFELGPEGILQKLGNVFGYQDINFRTHSKFSSNYELKGMDEPAVRALFNEKVLDYFERLPSKWSIECRMGRMLFYKQNSWLRNDRIKSGEIQSCLDEAVEIVKLLLGAATTKGPQKSDKPTITGDAPSKPKEPPRDKRPPAGLGDFTLNI